MVENVIKHTLLLDKSTRAMTDRNVRYMPLLQSTPSDDEEEFDDHVSFEMSMEDSNGFKHSKKQKSKYDIIELGSLTESRLHTDNQEEVKFQGRSRKSCLLLSALIVIVGGAVAAIVLPLISWPVTHTSSHADKDWSISYDNSVTESCVRTLDVDGDGRDDILIGISNPELTLSGKEFAKTVGHLKQFCSEHHLSSPCVGLLVALRGYNGKELWKIPTRSGILFITCNEVDVNKDGRPDCIVTGRHGTTQAVDIHEGKSLWSVDVEAEVSHFHSMWNTYQALTMPDFNNDGIPEILLAHGGDPYAKPENHDRQAGRLILLSGATGKPIGRFLSMPNNKETYMSPLQYRAPDGSRYVLFGSGGETVPGDLMAVSFSDLYRRIKGYSSSAPVPGMHNGTADFWWHGMSRGPEGFITIYKGQDKGVMVPPVLVDVTNDGADDILMTAFEGKMIMFDGKTLSPLWTAEFPGMESYSLPAPGYFDDDDILDFMVHWSAGVWPDYNYTLVVVVSGVDGKTIWSSRTSKYGTTSDLILQETQAHRDLFIIKMKGRMESGTKSDSTMQHAAAGKRSIHRRHFGNDESHHSDSDLCEDLETDYGERHPACGANTDSLTMEIVAVDGSTSNKGLKLLQVKTDVFHYEMKPRGNESTCTHLDPITKKANYCSVFEPSVKTTDAVADVDGDGNPDLISLNLLIATLHDTRYSYVRKQSKILVSKTNISAALQHGTVVELNASTVTDNKASNAKEHFGSMTFVPMSRQRWTEYLGSKTDGKYEHTKS